VRPPEHRLLQVGMHLDLVHPGFTDETPKVRELEVGDADHPGRSGPLRIDEGLPGLHVAILGRHRPVDEI
jgi:hypothetical protein